MPLKRKGQGLENFISKPCPLKKTFYINNVNIGLKTTEYGNFAAEKRGNDCSE
jgi:hypothetical protein